jgi:prepilin-type N-terminal cleavage/methylation domain-containing protein
MKTKNLKNEAARNQRGFTLIETSISMVVMMVGALAVSSLFVFSTQNNVGGGERALAMAVAQQQLEQIRSVAFEDTSLDLGTITSTVRNGERNYTVQKVVANEANLDTSAKKLKRITIRVTPQTAGPSWLRSTVELVSLRSTLAAGSFAVSE